MRNTSTNKFSVTLSARHVLDVLDRYSFAFLSTGLTGTCPAVFVEVNVILTFCRLGRASHHSAKSSPKALPCQVQFKSIVTPSPVQRHYAQACACLTTRKRSRLVGLCIATKATNSVTSTLLYCDRDIHNLPSSRLVCASRCNDCSIIRNHLLHGWLQVL